MPVSTKSIKFSVHQNIKRNSNSDLQEETDGSSQNGEAEPDTGEIENVRVVVRVRPLDKIELDAGNLCVVKVDKVNRCVTVTKPNSDPGEPPRLYYFDNVFAEDSTQVSDICIFLSVFTILSIRQGEERRAVHNSSAADICGVRLCAALAYLVSLFVVFK